MMPRQPRQLAARGWRVHCFHLTRYAFQRRKKADHQLQFVPFPFSPSAHRLLSSILLWFQR